MNRQYCVESPAFWKHVTWWCLYYFGPWVCSRFYGLCQQCTKETPQDQWRPAVQCFDDEQRWGKETAGGRWNRPFANRVRCASMASHTVFLNLPWPWAIDHTTIQGSLQGPHNHISKLQQNIRRASISGPFELVWLDAFVLATTPPGP